MAPGSVASFADWLSISLQRHAYEGDRVVVRCSGEENDKIKKLMYYKDGSQIASYSSASSHSISNARPRDSGSYFCKADRTKFFFFTGTEESSSRRLTVQGEGLTIQVGKSGVKQSLCGRPRLQGRGDHLERHKLGVSVWGGVQGWVLLTGAEKTRDFSTGAPQLPDWSLFNSSLQSCFRNLPSQSAPCSPLRTPR